MIDIDKLILEARKARSAVELKAYQNIKAEIQKNQTAKGAKPLTDELQLQIIAKYAKTLEDSISQFLEGSREDLASEYRSELEVVQKLLPEPVTERDIILELANFVGSVKLGPVGPATKDGQLHQLVIKLPKKDTGNAIKHIKSVFPTANGKMVSEIVKKYIV